MRIYPTIGYSAVSSAHTTKKTKKVSNPNFDGYNEAYKQYLQSFDNLYKILRDAEYPYNKSVPLKQAFKNIFETATNFPNNYKSSITLDIVNNIKNGNVRWLLYRLNHNCEGFYDTIAKRAALSEENNRIDFISSNDKESPLSRFVDGGDFNDFVHSPGRSLKRYFHNLFEDVPMRAHHDCEMWFSNPETEQVITIMLDKNDTLRIEDNGGYWETDDNCEYILSYKSFDCDTSPWSGTTF